MPDLLLLVALTILLLVGLRVLSVVVLPGVGGIFWTACTLYRRRAALPRP